MKRKLLLLLGMVFIMTTMLVCAVGCKKEDAHKHTWSTEWSADGETHWHACTGDGCTAKKDAGSHEGGTATCTEKATCSVCGAKYGELDATNHASSAFTYVSNGDGTHTKKYACCNVAAEEPENCSGGTATCTEKATCSLCNAKYGELDATNHTETTYKYEANNDGTHKKIHTCCNAVEVAAETCSGGPATVCGEKNVCEHCNAEYGDPLAHEWKTEYVFGNNQHWHECSRTGCTATSEKENCSGGTATCIEKATCATCHNKYGELDATNHTETTYKYEANNDGTHKKIHTCCNAVEVAAEACSGGTATCTEKATCSLCNAKYGDTIAHTEVTDAAVAATCTEKGRTEGKHCSVCNTVLVAQTEIPALGHTEVTDAAVAATCTEKGKTEGKHCSVCNTVLVAQTEVAALGHDYASAWTKDGENHWHECTRCHEKKDIAAHKVSAWKVGDTEDTALCECGEELDETFVKTVTAKRQDLVVTTYTNASLDKNANGWYTYTETYNTNASIVLTGVTYESIVSVKFGDATLGNALTGLNLSALTDFTKHGEQSFTVIVKDKYDLEHTITVPVLLVTREISTATEMMILGNSKNYGTNVTISGYYRLKNDLISGMREYTQSWVTFNRAVFDGNNHKIKLGHYYHYAPGNGLFRNINGSTIKNLTIDTDYLNKGTAHVVLASEAFGGSVFENITINYIDSVDTNPNNATYNQDFATDTCNTQGFLFASNVASCTFKNFTINANHKKIGVLLGRANAWGNGSLDSCKFENFKVLNCAGMGALAWKGKTTEKYMLGEVEGITVDVLENITLSAQDIILADKDGEKTEFTLNLGDYDGTILGVTFGASALTVQGKAINIPDAMKNGKHGANTLYVTTQKADGKKYYITVPVTIVTEEITTLERLTACITYKTNTNNEKWQDGK